MPLYGIDGEVGWRVPVEQWGMERSGLQSLGQAVHEWRVYAGGFHFDSNQAKQNISGPRARSEWRILDIIPGHPGSRLTLAFEFQWDDVRDDQWKGGLLFRIPLGGGSRKPVQAPRTHQHRLMRMTERIVRDVDVVVGQSERERAVNARTGVPFENVTVIDGNTVNPEGTIEGAGNNSVVIANGQAGTITPADTVDMNNGQVLMGGGSNLTVRGANTGALATFAAPGTRGMFSISAGTDVELINGASNASIVGVDLVTADFRANAIVLRDNTDILIDTVGITTTGEAARGIESFGTSQFTVNNSIITTTGEESDGIVSRDNSRFTVNNSTITTRDNGIQLAGTSQGTVNHTTITTHDTDAEAIALSDISQGTINDSVITTIGDFSPGIVSEDDSQLTVNDSTIITSGEGADGIVSIDADQLTVNNSTIMTTGINSFGIFSADNNQVTLNNLAITTNGDDAPGIVSVGNNLVTVNGGNIATTGPNADGVIVSAFGTQTFLLNGVTINSAANGVFLESGAFGSSTINGTIRDSTINAGASFDAVSAVTDGTATQNLSIFANTLNNGVGTIRLNEIAGDINVTQGAPGSGAGGLDVLNGIPTANVLIPGNPIDFNQPAPLLP